MPETIIVGSGQAGLATAYHLSRLGQPARIITADSRVGDNWRNRWDSLHLFTPAFYNQLPGAPFPADDPYYLPSKDEVADFLEAYAERLDVPIRLGTRVTAVRPADGPAGDDDAGTDAEGVGGAGEAGSPDRFVLETDDGPVSARSVVLATGPYRTPHVPDFADELHTDIARIHSSGYRNPDGLPDGHVLVVGAGASGTQIATEVARARPHRSVWLSGRDTGRLPRTLLGIDIYRWIGPTVFRIRRDTFLGRRLARNALSGGDPVFNNEHRAMVRAGVRRVGRTTGTRDGRPVVEEEGTLDVAAVVWATGYRNDYGWVRIPGALRDGRPVHVRGVSPVPGFFFVGLPFLYRFGSSLLGGVSEDAEFLARTIAAAP